MIATVKKTREELKAERAALTVLRVRLLDATEIELQRSSAASMDSALRIISYELNAPESDFFHYGKHIIRKSLIARIWKEPADWVAAQ